MIMGWASNRDRKHLGNTSPVLFLLSPALLCSKMMSCPIKWDSLREGQSNIIIWMYSICICQLYMYLCNCPLCGSWQGEPCLRNGRRASIDPVLTESILQIMFSNRLNRNANTISWDIGMFGSWIWVWYCQKKQRQNKLSQKGAIFMIKINKRGWYKH